MKNHFIRLICVLIVYSCSKDSNSLVLTKEYSFDETNSYIMLQDGESIDLITSEDRKFEIGKVLRVKPIDNFTIEVSNFTPLDLENVTITAKINEIDQELILFKINKISAHALKQIRYSFLEEGTVFYTSSGEEIDLSKYKLSGIDAENIILDFSGETEILKKLKSLNKLNWKIRWHDYGYHIYNATGDKWKIGVNAKDFRMFSGLMINLAYTVVSDEFRQDFINETITDNGGTYMTWEDKEQVLQRLFDIKFFEASVSTDRGWGGGKDGKTFGMPGYVVDGYLANPEYPFIHMATHEIGHMLGYWHSSSMTYPQPRSVTPEELARGIKPRGISEVGARVAKILKKDYPVNIENYYKPDDFNNNSSRKFVNNNPIFNCQLH